MGVGEGRSKQELVRHLDCLWLQHERQKRTTIELPATIFFHHPPFCLIPILGEEHCQPGQWTVRGKGRAARKVAWYRKSWDNCNGMSLVVIISSAFPVRQRRMNPHIHREIAQPEQNHCFNRHNDLTIHFFSLFNLVRGILTTFLKLSRPISLLRFTHATLRNPPPLFRFDDGLT